jgi:hypothetical protein
MPHVLQRMLLDHKAAGLQQVRPGPIKLHPLSPSHKLTNSVVAYIDTQDAADGGFSIRVFPVPQLVAHGEIHTLSALPSFLYFPNEDELAAGAVGRPALSRSDNFRTPAC